MRSTVLAALAVLVAATAEGQTLGTFRWQLQPYCNVLTVTVVQQGGQYQVDGTDDQCGAAQQASVVGRAFPNPDGSIGFGLTTVTTTAATAIHIDARLNVATLGGTWRDSAGNSGAFAFRAGAGTGGSPRPVPPGGIAPGTLTGAQLAAGTITGAQLAAGSITGAQLAAGTITATQLAPSAVATAVGALGSCPAGQYLRGFQGGGPVCEPILVAPTTTAANVVPSTSVGVYPDIAIGPGSMAVIAHTDTTNGDLVVTNCLNPACTAASSVTVDASGAVGQTPAVAIGADGRLVIAHTDLTNGDLRVTHCNNGSCSNSTTTATDTVGSVGQDPAIAIGADGLPVIAHRDITNSDLRVTHCLTVSCSSSTSTTVATDDGYLPSIAIGATGFPVIVYQSLTQLTMVRCQNATCTQATSVVVHAINGTGRTRVVVPSDGRPVIAWQDDGSPVMMTKCADSGCSTSTDAVIADETMSDMALDSRGVPRLTTTPNLRWFHVWQCDDATCAHPTSGMVSTSGTNDSPAITMGDDGFPIVAYRDVTNGTLVVVKCNSQTCQ